MGQIARMPLESYLLAQQASPIECLVCGEENCRSSARCHYCSAPMALAHQALAVKQQPRLIAVLGATGAGKTTYLGMLMDMLTRQVGSLRTTPRGPLSISLQQTTSTALSTGSFPEKTQHHPDNWHWVHCQLHCQRRRRPLELVIPDISGDALAEETEKAGQYPAVRALLKKCSAVMVLADAERLKGGDRSHDFITMKLLSLLSDFRSKPRILSWGQEKRPLAFVLTKADACPGCAEDPRKFAEAHAGALLTSCQMRFERCEVFSCSVAGATAYRDICGARRHVPLRVEPTGIVEPMGWLMTELA
jgi:hypothetical protein